MEREAGMMTVSGVQGVGKTYQNMHLIALTCQTLTRLKTVNGLLIAITILVNRVIPLLAWQNLNTAFLTAT